MRSRRLDRDVDAGQPCRPLLGTAGNHRRNREAATSLVGRERRAHPGVPRRGPAPRGRPGPARGEPGARLASGRRRPGWAGRGRPARRTRKGSRGRSVGLELRGRHSGNSPNRLGRAAAEPHAGRGVGAARGRGGRTRQETAGPGHAGAPARVREPGWRQGTAARRPRRPPRRVVPRALGRHSQWLRKLLHPPGACRAHRAADLASARVGPAGRLRRHAEPGRAALKLDPNAARGDPRAHRMRSRVRVRHLPPCRASIPHRFALRLAPAPRPNRVRR